jgi:nitrite reductase (NAD(P)H)
MCPHKRAFVLDHGIVGDSASGGMHVSCPLHKRNFKLDTGECTNDAELGVLAFEVKAEGEDIHVRLPPLAELEDVIGTSKWVTKEGTATEMGSTVAATAVGGCGSSCGDPKLEW